jgi:hypothetical protein
MGNKLVVAPEPIQEPVSAEQRALIEQQQREVEALRLVVNERIAQLIKDTKLEPMEDK